MQLILSICHMINQTFYEQNMTINVYLHLICVWTELYVQSYQYMFSVRLVYISKCLLLNYCHTLNSYKILNTGTSLQYR